MTTDDHRWPRWDPPYIRISYILWRLSSLATQEWPSCTKRLVRLVRLVKESAALRGRRRHHWIKWSHCWKNDRFICITECATRKCFKNTKMINCFQCMKISKIVPAHVPHSCLMHVIYFFNETLDIFMIYLVTGCDRCVNWCNAPALHQVLVDVATDLRPHQGPRCPNDQHSHCVPLGCAALIG